MPIIIFQVAIILSLVVARGFSKKALTTVAVCWSVFTLIMVFMPWLMILQLAIIWGTYAVISPKDQAK